MVPQTEAYLPGMSEAEKRDPKISPLYANMGKLKCPPALFTCGTLDPLLDDTVMMSTKWMMSGAESILKIYPGESQFYNSSDKRDLPILIRCTSRLHSFPTISQKRDHSTESG